VAAKEASQEALQMVVVKVKPVKALAVLKRSAQLPPL
jgi:hypothetical protein